MKTSAPLLQILAVTVAVSFAGMTTAVQAQNYPWCAHYGTPYDDTSCGFVSYEQCMASVNGVGGFCQRNDTYRPPVVVRPQARRHHPKNS